MSQFGTPQPLSVLGKLTGVPNSKVYSNDAKVETFKITINTIET